MKYGIIIHKETKNIGDDVQWYAASQFLPHVDYAVPREDMFDFKTDNGEPVAVIGNAWYMWQKWNWPPAKCIVPLFVSMHYSISDVDVQKGESPSTDEFLRGIGKEYMDSHAPIGCRDKHTLEVMQNVGIDSYFSGCLTLTIPKHEKIEVEKEYICLVDVTRDVERIIRKQLAGQPIEIKKFGHIRDAKVPELDWKIKRDEIKERLTIYQNAKCIVTGRLHCALPCLAMEVPVYMVTPKQNSIRLKTYLDFLHHATEDDFLAGTGYKYDYMNPPENKKDYVPYREALIERVTKFVEEMENSTSDKVEDFVKTTYTDLEFYKWHSEMERQVLLNWRVISKAKSKENKKLLKKVEKFQEERAGFWPHVKAKRFLGKVKRRVLG